MGSAARRATKVARSKIPPGPLHVARRPRSRDDLDQIVVRLLCGTAIRAGGQKLLATVRRDDPTTAWPSHRPSATAARHGVRAAPPPTAVPTGGAPFPGPNATWTTDFKGEFPRATGVSASVDPARRVQPLCGRWMRCSAACFLPAGASSARFATWVARPIRAITASRLPVRPSAGSRPECLVDAPRSCQRSGDRNRGSHEQFHAVLKATRHARRRPIAARQQRFRRFVAGNQERPHESLGDRPPRPSITSRRARCPRACRRSSMPGIWKFGASEAMARRVGRPAAVFDRSARRRRCRL